MSVTGIKHPGKFHTLVSLLNKQKYIHMMILPAIIWLVVFAYIPMAGIQVAFRDYIFRKGMWGSPWIGLANFVDFFTDINLPRIMTNTMAICLLKVFLLYPIPIILALMLNEVRNRAFKRIVQTVSYFPYFISFVTIAFLATNWLSASNGFVNAFLMWLGILDKPYLFLGKPEAFWWISLGLDGWKNIGWGSIIYLAAISSIDQEMYEAATIDGANKFHNIIYITLPSILPTIMVMFILNIGYMLGGGLYASNFDCSYLLGNPLNAPTSEILDLYVFKIGISLGRYSYATAIGLLQSLVSLVLLFGANSLSNKITNESFF